MIEEEIKKANIEAIKNKDTVARAFYSVLMNKILLERINKREKGQLLDDTDIAAILQKMIKELGDEKENYHKAGNETEVKNIERQIEIAQKYLPKQLTREEIKLEISKLDDKKIPNVMKHFKMNFQGRVDMRLVQEVLKEFV